MLPPLAAMMRARRSGMPFQMFLSTFFGILVMSGRTNALQSAMMARPGA